MPEANDGVTNMYPKYIKRMLNCVLSVCGIILLLPLLPFLMLTMKGKCFNFTLVQRLLRGLNLICFENDSDPMPKNRIAIETGLDAMKKEIRKWQQELHDFFNDLQVESLATAKVVVGK